MARKKSAVELPPVQNAVIYARYSSHNQREESIEQQIDECMAFASANNLNVIEIYSDKAISGKTDRRTSFQRLLRDAEKRKFQVVIAYKSNRIARNMLTALQYEAKLDGFGIKTLYAKEEFGDTAAGRFALRTMMNVNQFYSENMAEDIRRGMMDNAAACKSNGHFPFGYVRGEDGKFAIEKTEAAIVKEVFEKVLSGVSFADIANDLNARGIKTKRGNRWNKNSFHRMLRNESYIGVFRYADIIVPNGIPPIISKEVFESMQQHLQTKKNPQGRHRENGDYLLTGKLYCGYCQSYMVGASGTGKHGELHYYYICQQKRKDHSCNKENVRRDWIERRIAELSKATVLRDDVIEWIAENAVSFQQQARRSSGIAILEQELADNHKVQKNIMSAIEAGIFTVTTKDRLLEVEANISKLEKELALEKARNVPIEKERIIYALEKFRHGDVNDKGFQKKLIDTFVRAVYLFDDHIKIDYYYAGKNNSLEFPLNSEDTSASDEVEGSFRLPLAPPLKSASKVCFEADYSEILLFYRLSLTISIKIFLRFTIAFPLRRCF